VEHYDFRVEQGDITVCTVTEVEHAVTTVEYLTPQWSNLSSH